MELEFYERCRRLSGKSGSAVLHIRLPHLCGGNQAIEECYRCAADALEDYAQTKWLADLADAFSKTARQSRLHRIEPHLDFICQGVLVADRYVSIALTLTKQSLSESVQTRAYRVWDGKEGILCPIELFIPKKNVRVYDRWSFQLQEREILALPRKQRNGNVKRLICIGKWKNQSLPIDNVGRVC